MTLVSHQKTVTLNRYRKILWFKKPQFSAVRRTSTAVFIVWRKKTAEDSGFSNQSTELRCYSWQQFIITKLWTDLEFSKKDSAVLHEDKNDTSFFSSDWIKSVQNGSNLSKMDKICPKWIKSVQNGSNCPKWIISVQNGSILSKLATTWLNCIFHPFQFELMTLVRFSKYCSVSDVGLNQFSKHCSVPRKQICT